MLVYANNVPIDMWVIGGQQYVPRHYCTGLLLQVQYFKF